MTEFYKTLLETAGKSDKGIVVGDDTFENVFKKMGYHDYDLGGLHVYTQKPLTEEEIAHYQKQYNKDIMTMVENYTKEIDQHILEDLIKTHPEYVNKKGNTETRG